MTAHYMRNLSLMQDLSVRRVVILWSESLDACTVNVSSEMVQQLCTAFAVSLLHEVLIFI